MSDMKKYIQLMESTEDNEFKNHYDDSFKVDEEDGTFYVVGENTGDVYASYDNEEDAELRKDNMNEIGYSNIDNDTLVNEDLNEREDYRDEHGDVPGEQDTGPHEYEEDKKSKRKKKREMNEDEFDDEMTIDSELDNEMSMEEPMDTDRIDTDFETIDYQDPEVNMNDESEDEDLMYNYTATIQLHGYDYPLVLNSDSIDEFKTVMKVLRQSGLNPEGEYKWNSRTFTLEDENGEPITESEEGGPFDSKEMHQDLDVSDKMKKKSDVKYDKSDLGVDGYENGSEEEVYNPSRNVPTDKQDRTIKHKDVSKDRKIDDPMKPDEPNNYDTVDGGQDIYDNTDEMDVFKTGNEGDETGKIDYEATDQEIRDILKMSGQLDYSKSDQGENLSDE